MPFYVRCNPDTGQRVGRLIQAGRMEVASRRAGGVPVALVPLQALAAMERCPPAARPAVTAWRALPAAKAKAANRRHAAKAGGRAARQRQRDAAEEARREAKEAAKAQAQAEREAIKRADRLAKAKEARRAAKLVKLEAAASTSSEPTDDAH